MNHCKTKEQALNVLGKHLKANLDPEIYLAGLENEIDQDGDCEISKFHTLHGLPVPIRLEYLLGGE